jgi:hypothetical protein
MDMSTLKYAKASMASRKLAYSPINYLPNASLPYMGTNKQPAHRPGLWKDATQPVTFSLVVDDFGVKYLGKHNADHLFQALEEHYESATDWESTLLWRQA